ncbi:hypothetical protein [Nocardiopsis nanhaiensis]
MTVSVRITWSVSWSGSDGEGGGLDDLATTTTTTVRVVESSGVVT